MARAAGVDGARGGWAVVISEGGRLRVCPAKSFYDIFDREYSFDIVAVDVPIGLLDRPQSGGRSCEQAARKLLGAPRSTSVFPSPARNVLGARSYQDACARSSDDPPGGPKISRQTFGILPKIEEVDKFLQERTDLCRLIYEVHPEVSFHEMQGMSMKDSKKRSGGRKAREAALRSEFGDFDEMLTSWRAGPKEIELQLDDIIDATAACWTALRLAKGEGRSLVDPVPCDSKGLKMTIWV